MRFQERYVYFLMALFGGIVVLALLGITQVVVVGGWILGFAAIGFAVFRCPHCGRCALFGRHGHLALGVGTHCRGSGKEY